MFPNRSNMTIEQVSPSQQHLVLIAQEAWGKSALSSRRMVAMLILLCFVRSCTTTLRSHRQHYEVEA